MTSDFDDLYFLYIGQNNKPSSPPQIASKNPSKTIPPHIPETSQKTQNSYSNTSQSNSGDINNNQPQTASSEQFTREFNFPLPCSMENIQILVLINSLLKQ